MVVRFQNFVWWKSRCIYKKTKLRGCLLKIMKHFNIPSGYLSGLLIGYVNSVFALFRDHNKWLLLQLRALGYHWNYRGLKWDIHDTSNTSYYSAVVKNWTLPFNPVFSAIANFLFCDLFSVNIFLHHFSCLSLKQH